MSFPVNLISLKTCFFLAFSSRLVQLACDPYSIGISDIVIISCLVYALNYRNIIFSNPEPKEKEKQITEALSMLTNQLTQILDETEKKESEVKRKIQFFENKKFLNEEECGEDITKELYNEFKDLTWLSNDDIYPFDPDK